MECENQPRTIDLSNMIQQCDNPDDFKRDILVKLRAQREDWKDRIKKILEEGAYTLQGFADVCQVSAETVRKWKNGSMPRSRDHFLRIGFGARYDIEQMNYLLQRYGGYPGLYAKSLDDCVCMFVLKQPKDVQSYRLFRELSQRMALAIAVDSAHGNSTASTEMLFYSIRNLNTERDFEKFLSDNKGAFRDAYSRLYSYIRGHIERNNMDYVEGKPYSVSTLAEAQGWTSSMRQAVSAIYQKKWFPHREKLISLCLHLNMSLEQINEALAFAKMEPLCAKRPMEAAVMYAILDAELNGVVEGDGTNDLCVYVLQKLKTMAIPNAESFLQDIETPDNR